MAFGLILLVSTLVASPADVALGAPQTAQGGAAQSEASATSPQARLSAVEKGRQTVKGAEVITYTFRAEGLPKDKVYILVGQWLDGKTAEAGKGLQIDESGRIVGTDGEEMIVSFASMIPGEFVVIALVSEDRTAKASVEVTPFPNQAEGKGGCRLSVQPMIANGQVFRMTGEGFIPNHDIRISATSSGEHSSQTVKGKADGSLNFSIFPAVVGKTGGDASFTASDSECSATVNYNWGDQLRGSKLTAEQREALEKKGGTIANDQAQSSASRQVQSAPNASGDKGGWSALNTEGMVLAQQNKLAEAEPLLVKALAMAEKEQGPNGTNVGEVSYELASLYTSERKFKEAESHFKRALSIVEAAKGPDDPNVASILYSYAVCNAMQGKYENAEPLLRRSLTIAEKAFGPDSTNVATILSADAAVLKAMNRPEEASMMETRARKILQKSSPQ
jgi:hypothetical protein